MLRSYLVLAGGLMFIAVTLDFAFGQLQSRQPRVADPLVGALFHSVESTLLKVAPADRSAAAQELTRQLGIGVQILESNDINATPIDPTAADDNPQTLIDSADNSFYLKRSDTLRAAIRLGPVAEHVRGDLARLLPVVFYLSILLVVGSLAAPAALGCASADGCVAAVRRRLSEPLTTAHLTTQLTSLARISMRCQRG